MTFYEKLIDHLTVVFEAYKEGEIDEKGYHMIADPITKVLEILAAAT